MDWFACTPLGAPGIAVSRPERFGNDRFWQILLQKSKIERPEKSRESQFLGAATTAKPITADTKTGGRFCRR
jgi:hypothetical protein